MKYKNCGVIGTKHVFINVDEVGKYDNNIILSLTVLEGAITAVSLMQKQF